MSPVNRQVTGAAIMLSLGDEIALVKEQLATGKERGARTLIKDGSLRATLVGLAAGLTHSVSAPAGGVFLLTVSVQPKRSLVGDRPA